jgi:crotonobetainyl-CoA:carnitine CoA-transferase CaiB-like acyl-CoA transferase
MEMGKRLLNSNRVLDLTDERGFLCGKILADLGADVIKIEKPGGDKARSLGPFYHEEPSPEKSLYWFAYNMNKRGITLNIESKEGRKILIELASTADFIIESFAPGYLDDLGLSYLKLSRTNPRIIMTSITPFGQTGPYKNYKASDIEVMAMGGLMYITGDPEQPPLRISLPQAFLLASAHGAAASMVAHFYRETSGEGQHVDVSAQECVLWEIANAIPLWELNQNILKRAGSYMAGRWKGTKQRLLWKCKNGYVLFYILGGAFGVKTNRAIVKWMEEENIAPEYLKNFNWDAFDMATQTQEMQDQIETHISKLFSMFTKEELYNGALKRGIMLCPVNTSKDIFENVQLKDRGFWMDINHPELLSTSITYPGAFAKLSETPVNIRCRAPLIGEHNLEIYQGELGLSSSKLNDLLHAGII